MEIEVDARGCACPEPVIKTKKAMEQEHDRIVVLVDNRTALENVKRFAGKKEHQAEVEEIDDYYKLILKRRL